MKRRSLIVMLALTLSLSTSSFVNKMYAETNCNNTSAQVHYKNAVKHSVNGLFDRAINEYLNCINIDPNFADAYNNLGYIYIQKGKVDLAIDHYKKALELDPNDDTTHSNLAGAYDCKGDYDLAIAEFYKALDIDPGSITVELAIEKVLKKKAALEGRSFEEVQAEVTALYPRKKEEPCYNKYMDLLEDSEEETITNTTQKSETTPESPDIKESTSSGSTEIISIPPESSDMKELTPSATTGMIIVPPEEANPTEQEQVKQDNTTTQQTSDVKKFNIQDYMEEEIKIDSSSKPINSEAETTDTKNKVYELLKDPQVGALMVLYKEATE